MAHTEEGSVRGAEIWCG